MSVINNQTEKEFRDKQNTFGHLHNGADLEYWLKQTYYAGSIRELRYRTIVNDFLETGKHNLNVLEIAAGVGDFIAYCAKLHPLNNYYANELSENLLKNNIEKVSGFFGVEKLPKMFFGEVEKINQPDNFFDVIFIKASVHHFENPGKAFEEIHRILKPKGKVVFFEDPVCLNIPVYRYFVKKNFSLYERSLGINEHIYTVPEYFLFGKLFSNKDLVIDKILIKDFDEHQKIRKGIKKIIFSVIRGVDQLFFYYMVYRFSPVIFVFTK